MPKRKEPETANVAHDTAADAIDRAFATWLDQTETYLKRLFVPDHVLAERVKTRVLIDDAKQLAQMTGTDLTVALLAAATEEKPTPEQSARIMAVTAEGTARRKQVAALIGRDESKAWRDDQSDKTGTGGARFDKDGVMTALGPYWAHVAFIGEQLATVGLRDARPRHATRARSEDREKTVTREPSGV